jgi:hypothetical protein
MGQEILAIRQADKVAADAEKTYGSLGPSDLATTVNRQPFYSRHPFLKYGGAFFGLMAFVHFVSRINDAAEKDEPISLKSVLASLVKRHSF